MPDKVIVSNEGALRAKYGDDFDLQAILVALLQADAARGVQTSVVRIDDQRDMGAVQLASRDRPLRPAAGEGRDRCGLRC
jgi:hypothetical protein